MTFFQVWNGFFFGLSKSGWFRTWVLKNWVWKPSFAAEHKKETSLKFQVSLLSLVQNQRIKSTNAEKQVNRTLKTFSFSGVSKQGFPNLDSKLIFTSFLKLKSKAEISHTPKLPFLTYFKRPCVLLGSATLKF